MSNPADGEAESWMARLLAPDCTPADRAAFEDWLAQAPENVEAWLEVERLQMLSAQLRSDEMLRAATRAVRRAPARVGWRRWVPAAAAAVLVLAVTTIWWRQEPFAEAEPQQFATTMGEQSEVTLADGTVVLLDTGSRLTARFDGRQRLVELERGRAQFVVGVDPDRPFLVKAGAGTVRDIGTTFQVSHRADAVNVGVLEGRVDVSAGGGTATALAPGEQVDVDTKGRIGTKAPLDVVAARAWPQGDLVFKQRRLDELLAEMNRYSKQQVRLADPALGALTVSGVFHAGDQDALVAVLERGWSLRAERKGAEEIVLHASDR
ncbi:FecR domain-containing protein [Lysobacter sp. FW306-1B-D06B]|uniref:FecR family protein n=1 Tax=Lysobacter sp. FW306-1B-D06B TaxID=3140250 RepID=UPI0031409817